MKEHRESQFHSIGDVKTETGLTERRIRYYETLHLLSPQRTAGNQRLYSNHDVERLKTIKQLLDSGQSLRHVREKLKEMDVVTRRDESLDLERDAESYFEGKRIAWREERKDHVALTDRQAMLRRIMREHSNRGDDE